MKLLEFANYRKYKKAQLVSDTKKTKRYSVSEIEVNRIIGALDGTPGNILCHGARHGHELDFFRRVVPTANVIGTDLFLKEHPDIVEWDFSRQKSEWVNKFDLIYTNSFDHARYPVECAKVWVEQLKDNIGVLAVQWNSGYMRKRNKGDCFGGSLDEFVTLLNELGEVKDILYMYRSNLGFKVVILVKKKQDDLR